MPIYTLSQILKATTEAFKKAGLDTPDLDARLLTQKALGLSRDELRTHADKSLNQTQTEQIQALAHRRTILREPVSRILGEREFWGLPFRLSPATLDPRPDSETVVEAALAVFPDKNAPLRVLDLGTGTGCLLLAVLSERPQARGLGIDQSSQAIKTAEENARNLGLSQRAWFQVGNWTEELTEHFDLILSNPPYIAETDIPALEPEVRQHDPHLALAGGLDGLEAYRTLIPQLPAHLKPHGYIILEVGQGQAEPAKTLLEQHGFLIRDIRKDIQGIPRAMVAYRD